jgi:hypothetical protein
VAGIGPSMHRVKGHWEGLRYVRTYWAKDRPYEHDRHVSKALGKLVWAIVFIYGIAAIGDTIAKPIEWLARGGH